MVNDPVPTTIFVNFPTPARAVQSRAVALFTLRSQLNQMFWASVRGGTTGINGLKKFVRLFDDRVLQSDCCRTSHVTPLPVHELLTIVVHPGGLPPFPVTT